MQFSEARNAPACTISNKNKHYTSVAQHSTGELHMSRLSSPSKKHTFYDNEVHILDQDNRRFKRGFKESR